jgi:hypothetical protein
MSELHEQGVVTAPAMHQGTGGKRALFLDKSLLTWSKPISASAAEGL